MTEEEWLAEQNRSQWMLMDLLRPDQVLRTIVGKRKLRLFVCGCCRMVWDFFEKQTLRAAVEGAERFADGEADKNELQRWFKETLPLVAGGSLGYLRRIPVVRTAAHMVTDACSSKAGSADFGPTSMPHALAGHSIGDLENEAVLCHLLRDVFGNPFRPAVMKREWLAWNDRTVEAVARSIYHDRAFDRMPVLGDALEDTGCDDETILTHCRGPGPHVRGCWVVDLCLGKA